MYSLYSILRVVSEENHLFIFPRLMLTKRHLSKACLLPFFGNACTKSGSLRFSQFSGCWL